MATKDLFLKKRVYKKVKEYKNVKPKEVEPTENEIAMWDEDLEYIVRQLIGEEIPIKVRLTIELDNQVIEYEKNYEDDDFDNKEGGDSNE